MAKVVPTDWPLIETQRMGPRQPIVDVPLRDVVRADARLYALAGSRLVGKTYDPAWQTTSSTYTTTTSSSAARSENLNRIYPASIARRISAGAKYLWLVSVSLANCTLRVRVYEAAGGSLRDTLTITNSGARDTVTGVLETVDVESYIKLDALATSGTASLWGVGVCEKILVAADLPLGD